MADQRVAGPTAHEREPAFEPVRQPADPLAEVAGHDDRVGSLGQFYKRSVEIEEQRDRLGKLVERGRGRQRLGRHRARP